MRTISTAVVVSLGFAFWSGGAFAQVPQITDTSRNLTTLSGRINADAEPGFAASRGALSSTFTPDQLSATTTRLTAAMAAPGQVTLGTARTPTPVTASASFATPTGAGNASLSVGNVNIAAVEPQAASSMAGVQASGVATDQLRAFTSTAAAPVLHR